MSVSAKERKLYISRKDLKVLLAKALSKTYKEISIEYNEESELIVEINTGHFTEQISFKDERILKELDFESLNLELDDVFIDESRYSYIEGANDEDEFYLFICKNKKKEEK